MEEIERIAEECSPALDDVRRQENFLRDRLSRIFQTMENKGITWNQLRQAKPKLFQKLSLILDNVKISKP
ncbi:hypothetical protein [Mongoliibacter ruber]|uniref:Uncharacterized protein n=1 Tax=Mongoliibacter ruber TaxID=1750599 RepID=A0A2T0WV57_9BACT|nr:hypothetical protein [Mongoliibacter ruber]PRY90567.1 hypothetical protein CLW00_101230 [Mongoliibacter ruber]